MDSISTHEYSAEDILFCEPMIVLAIVFIILDLARALNIGVVASFR